MKQSLKIGFVALVVAAFAASGLAFAQSNGSDDTVPPTDQFGGVVPDTLDGDSMHPGFGFRGGHGHHGMRGPGQLGQVADILGIDDPQVIVDALEAGDTLADVATAHGSSGPELVDQLVADLTERLNGAVADERITQERADAILAEATDRITTLVNSTQEEIQAAREAERAAREAEHEARRAERQQTLADVIGIPFDDIQAALDAGDTTLADIAAGQGVDLDTLVQGLVAPAAADLQAKVADGILTQEQADGRLAEITERVTQMVQRVPGDRPEFGGHHGHHGRRGGPGFGGGDGGFGGRGFGGPDLGGGLVPDAEVSLSA